MPGTNFPTGFDNSSTLPDPTNDTATENIHPDLHVTINAAIKALEAKFGVGASVPSTSRAGDLLSTDGAGNSLWGRYAVGGDLVGYLPNPTLVGISGVAGNWAAPTLTVDSKGRITAISNGVASPSILTTKGDLLGYSTSPNRLPVGSNGQILAADSTAPFGLKWAPAPNSGVWGQISGALTDQTDLQTALGLKVNTTTYNALVASLSVAAFSGLYNDLLSKPDLTIYMPKAGGTFTGAVVLAADPTVALAPATKQYVDAKGTTSFKYHITPTGSINGSNTSFTVPDAYATGTLQVFLNGLALRSGASNDYVETTTGFTMNYAPATGDVLDASYLVSNGTYIQGSNSIISGEAPLQTPNSSLTAFTVGQSKYVAGSLIVTLNGIFQVRGTDFTETTPGSGIFTFTVAPNTGDVVRCSYQIAFGASGNADTVDGYHANATPTASQLLPLNSRAQSGEWWEELARVTLTVAGDVITASSIPAKKYLRFIAMLLPTAGTISASLKYNNDTAANYNHRYSENAAVDASAVSQTTHYLDPGSAAAAPIFAQAEVINILAQEKLTFASAASAGTAGAANATNRRTYVEKWANTSAQINRIDITNGGTGDFAIGSELIILGHD
jgi:hypothetical protein